MNKSDIYNIKKILEFRKPIKFKKDGEYKIDELELKTSEELVQLLNDYKNENKKEKILIFKNIIDDIFTKYGKVEDNYIILTATDNYWNDYDISDVIHLKISEDNTWCNSVDLFRCDVDFTGISEQIYSLMLDLKIPIAGKYFKNELCIDEECIGYIAVNRNYEIVLFIYDCVNGMVKTILYDYTKGPEILMKL